MSELKFDEEIVDNLFHSAISYQQSLIDANSMMNPINEKMTYVSPSGRRVILEAKKKIRMFEEIQEEFKKIT